MSEIPEEAEAKRAHLQQFFQENSAQLIGISKQGNNEENTGRIMPIIEHWNGLKWNLVPAADTTELIREMQKKMQGPTNVSVYFGNLATISASNIWAFGSIALWQSGANPTIKALIAHWDGYQWSIVDQPAQQIEGSYFLSSVAISDTDIWAVGSRNAIPAQNSVPLIEHWDGKNWKVASLPFQRGSLQTITATSSNDAWVDGAIFVDSTNSVSSRIAHWDGHGWSSSVLPVIHSTASSVIMLALAPDNVWMVENSTELNALGQPGKPVILHWDGNQWKVRGDAPGNVSDFTLNALAANGANDVWAAGSALVNVRAGTPAARPAYVEKLLIEHWDGHNWRVVQHNLPQQNATFIDMTIASGKVWAIGAIVDQSTREIRDTFLVTQC